MVTSPIFDLHAMSSLEVIAFLRGLETGSKAGIDSSIKFFPGMRVSPSNSFVSEFRNARFIAF